MKKSFLVLLAGVALAAALAACADKTSPQDKQQIQEKGGDCTDVNNVCKEGLVCAHDGTCQDPGTGAHGAKKAGDACAGTDDCLYGLVCGPASTCIPGGVAAEGAQCGVTADCQNGLVCSSLYVCVEPGTNSADMPCRGAQDCRAGLVCAGDLKCKDPAAAGATGVAGLGEACAALADCQLGLFCFMDGTCQAPEVWPGTDCAQSDDEQGSLSYPFKIYFEVPRAAKQPADFYRLPFPSDIRLKGGRVDLAGHPAPATTLGGGFVQMYLDAIEEEMTGFSTQAAVFFRFSKSPDFNSIALDGPGRNFYLVDVTPGSPGYGEGWSYGMFVTTGRGKYICQNWISMKPADGRPLRHATTYAVIAKDTIRLAGGGAQAAADDDFAAMLGAAEPSDADMAAAWRAYAPLRAYLADRTKVEEGEAAHVIAAAVFTTMDPDAVMAGLRGKVEECEGTDCADLPGAAPVGLARDAAASTERFHVVTGTVGVPVFQAGTPPYDLVGGGVTLDADGAPVIQRKENVQLALSVPAGAPPAEGWPVVLFAHGTGGSSRSFVDSGVADALAGVEVTLEGTPRTVKFAVLGIDGVQHSTRRGDSDRSPDVLYFNFLNPKAAKYNAVQGAADNFQLVRLVRSLHDAPATVTGVDDPVKLDPAQVYYFGHSQGSLTGPLFLAYSPDVKGTVLSGAGGNLTNSLLTKTRPVNIAAATKLVISDGMVDGLHPLLNLLQLYFDPVDVVNYGAGLTYEPVKIGETTDDPPVPVYAGPKHVFMSWGRDDHYSTEQTMGSFSVSMGLHQVDDSGKTCGCLDSSCDAVDADGLHEAACVVGGLPETTTPVRGNQGWNGTDYTAILKMYLPDGYDGHFVLFEHPDGPGDYAAFLASAVADGEGVPTLFP